MWKSTGIKLVVASLLILALLVGGGCNMFNKSPEITSLNPSASTVIPDGSCTISCVATDADGDTLTYSWSVTGGSISGTGDTVTWTAPTTLGSYTVTVSVSDGKAAAVSESCDIQVVNTPPVITNLTPGNTELPPGGSCHINCIASDADGDTLTYDWSATDGTISGTGSSVSWEAPAAEGTYTISVEVSDGKGGTDSESCEITVEMKYGSIDIQSSPGGAAVYLNGVDTGNITPYVITNLTPGTYDVELRLYHYKYREQAVTVNPNDTTYINWSLTYAPEITVTLQPNDVNGKDSYVYEPTPTNDYGDNSYVFAGAHVDGTCRAYLQFNLASLPPGVVIASARLGLMYISEDVTTQTEIGAYAVQQPWTESGVNWDDQPTCAVIAGDTHVMPTSPTSNFHYWYITNMVKSWYDGTLTNYGVVLRAINESAEEGWVGFYSSDWSTAQEHPKLIISFFDPTS
jgi:hypothetical protein